MSKTSIDKLKKAAVLLPKGIVPYRKPGSGALKNMCTEVEEILKREVLMQPSITAKELKEKYSELLQNLVVRTVQL